MAETENMTEMPYEESLREIEKMVMETDASLAELGAWQAEHEQALAARLAAVGAAAQGGATPEPEGDDFDARAAELLAHIKSSLEKADDTRAAMERELADTRAAVAAPEVEPPPLSQLCQDLAALEHTDQAYDALADQIDQLTEDIDQDGRSAAPQGSAKINELIQELLQDDE